MPMFGYKNHISIDRAHGFVRRFTVTHGHATAAVSLACCPARTIPRAVSGPARLTGAKTILRCCAGMGASHSSSAPSRADGPCPPISPVATQPGHVCARALNMCLRLRSAAWAC